MTTAERISTAQLNRTLLDRQGLLERSVTPVPVMIERLAGLQAQVPSNPYVALFSRIENFDPAELSRLVETKEAIRIPVMRATIHLLTARQARYVVPLAAPVLAGTFRSQFRKHLGGAGQDEIAAAGRELLERGPMTRAEVGKALLERWPDLTFDLLGQTVAHLLPLMQVPPRGEWGASHRATLGLVEREAGIELEADPGTERLVLDYLAAFGPATSADLRNWSRLTGLKAVIDRMRPDLRVYENEEGRELLDHPQGELTDPGVPAPVRFLPEYDNVLLGHQDRSRVLAGLGPSVPGPTGRWIGTLMADGHFRGYWKLEEDEDPVRLTIFGLREINSDSASLKREILTEAERLVDFIRPDLASQVVFREL